MERANERETDAGVQTVDFEQSDIKQRKGEERNEEEAEVREERNQEEAGVKKG